MAINAKKGKVKVIFERAEDPEIEPNMVEVQQAMEEEEEPKELEEEQVVLEPSEDNTKKVERVVNRKENIRESSKSWSSSFEYEDFIKTSHQKGTIQSLIQATTHVANTLTNLLKEIEDDYNPYGR